MKIVWTKPAIQDLENIQAYIAKDSEYYASRFVERIIETVEQLENFPKIGRFVPEAQDETIREILFHQYRIMYQLKNDKRILLLTIVHGSRDLTQRKPRPWNIF
jgi:addiction module RelE/StbE family toxin